MPVGSAMSSQCLWAVAVTCTLRPAETSTNERGPACSSTAAAAGEVEMAQPAGGRPRRLRACICGWGADCNAAREQQPWPFANRCLTIPRDREQARKLLTCTQLELPPERVKALLERACGVPAPAGLRSAQNKTAYVAGRKPKDVRIWIGHFLDDDLCGPMDEDGRPTKVKAETEHEHYVVTPLSGQQPAPVPARPRDGRDALVDGLGERAQRRAGRRPAAPSAEAGPFADMAAGGALPPVTPASMGTKKRRQPDTAVEPGKPHGKPRVEEAIPLQVFMCDFQHQLDLCQQVQAHAHQCRGKLYWRTSELSTHGVVARMVGRCSKDKKCTAAYKNKSQRLVWASSELNPDGQRLVNGKPFVDYVLNDVLATAEATTSVMHESFKTALMNTGLKPRSDAVTLAYHKQVVAPAMQCLREEEEQRVLNDRPGRENGEGGVMVVNHDVGHTGTRGQFSSGVAVDAKVCCTQLPQRFAAAALTGHWGIALLWLNTFLWPVFALSLLCGVGRAG